MHCDSRDGEDSGVSPDHRGTPCLLTVGVPAKNSESSIESTLQSILRSTCVNLRVVVSDNASTDATAAIVERLASQDARLSLVRHSHDCGATRNLQFLLEQAVTPYFAWVASDDLVTPDYLRDCVDILEANPQAVMAFGSGRITYADGGALATYRGSNEFACMSVYRRYWRVLRRFPSVHFYGVYRTEEAKAVGPMERSIFADTVFVRSLVKRGPIMGQYDSEYVYRVSPAWKSVTEYQTTMNGRAKRVRRGELALQLVRRTVRADVKGEGSRLTRLLLATEVLAAEAERSTWIGLAGLVGRLPPMRESGTVSLLVFRCLFGLKNVQIDDRSEFVRRIVRPALRWS